MIPRKTGEWILITKEIPVEAYVQPFSIFYGMVDKIYFPNELQAYQIGLNLPFELESLKYDSEDLRQMIDIYNRGKEVPKSVKKALDAIDTINMEYSMKIRTRTDALTVQPWEYNFIDLREYLEPVKDGHAFIKHMNMKQQKVSGKIGEQIFYLRSRGIGFTDAVMMISGNIKTQTAFYIEMHREYVKHFNHDWERIEAKRLKHKKKQAAID